MKRLIFLLLILPTVAQADTASWYSQECCRYNPDSACPTANGMSLYKLEADHVLWAAMWDVPFGAQFKVTNQANGKSVVVSILDRGPHRRLGRKIDLCKEAFERIADTKEGIIHVTVDRM